MDRLRVRKLLGWVLVAMGALGLMGTLANVRILLDSGVFGIATANAAWALIAPVIYLFAGIATLRDARWPWAVLLATFGLQTLFVAMNLVGNPSAGSWRWVQFAAFVPNLLWLVVLTRPSVRLAFKALPMSALERDTGSPV